MQNYKFLLTLAQELTEICYMKLQIGNFSAGDVRKWWKFSMVFLLNDRLVSSVPLPVQTSVEEDVGCHLHTNSYAQMMRNTPCEP